MKSFISKHKASLILYFIAFASVFVMLTAFAFDAGIDETALRVNIVRNIGDAFFLTSGFWLLPPRRRLLGIVPIAFVGAFALLNVWYFRFWDDILPVSCLTMTGNVDGLLINSVKGLPEWADLIYVLPLAIYGFACSRLSKETACGLPRLVRIGGFVASLVCFIASQALISEFYQRWLNHDFKTEHTLLSHAKYRITMPPDNAADYYRMNGMAVHVGRMFSMISETRNLRQPLSEDERAEVDRFISTRNYELIDETFAANQDKNIIFIIVESLNAEVLHRKVNNTEVTPTLNRLISAEGTIATTAMRSQVQEGCSGDGQLMYNTGILPLRIGCTPLHVIPHTEFVTLTSQLKRNIGGAVFADNANSWKQRENFGKYGFERISTCLDSPEETAESGSDAAMFSRGKALIDSVAQPFFMELITVSMHTPFQDNGVHGYNFVYDDPMIEKQEADYLRMCAYFDSQLSSFIDYLRKKGLYDNTMLIIASDHSQSLATSSATRRTDADIPIVFIATNTGTTKHIEGETLQIDVFPTILQIAGTRTAKFRGTGTSMLDSINHTDMETAQRISDLILRGNYFGTAN